MGKSSGRVLFIPDIFSSIPISDIAADGSDRSAPFAFFNENGVARTMLVTNVSDGAAGGDGTTEIVLSCVLVSKITTLIGPNETQFRRLLRLIDTNIPSASDGDLTYPIIENANPAASEQTLAVGPANGRGDRGPNGVFAYLRLELNGLAYTPDATKKLVIDVHGFA